MITVLLCIISILVAICGLLWQILEELVEALNLAKTVPLHIVAYITSAAVLLFTIYRYFQL